MSDRSALTGGAEAIHRQPEGASGGRAEAFGWRAPVKGVACPVIQSMDGPRPADAKIIRGFTGCLSNGLDPS